MRQLDIHLKVDDRYDTAIRCIKASDPVDYFVIPTEQRDRAFITVFLRDGTEQALMDALQSSLEGKNDWRITVAPIEGTAPKLEKISEEKQGQQKKATREELYNDVVDGADLNRDYLIMVALSTIVAAVGLNSDGVAAVIGAMVIAPLLGPILGFSMGSALGDTNLLRKATVTLTVGIAVALGVAVILSIIMPINLESRELMSRAEVRLDGMALAMAAGGAAALSLTRGHGTTLVGVMVAAALLPPGAALGLFIGAGEFALASRAGLLLALNIASLVLSALIVFRVRKIRPRKWIEQKNANRAMWANAALSAFFLLASIFLIIYLDLGSKVSIG